MLQCSLASSCLAGMPPVHTVREVLGPHGWVVAISFFVAVLATPAARFLAMRFRIVDRPDSFLKPHGRPIPYLGGVAIYLGWLAGLLLVLAHADTGWTWLLGLALGGGVIMLVGLVDDLVSLKPRTKLLGQVLAACILLAFGIGRNLVTVVFSPLGIQAPPGLVLGLSIPATVFLVLAASNATNLLDGMDGLCSGVTGIIALCFMVLAIHLAMYGHSETRDHVRIVASLAMFGAVLGFLPYNSNPAKIFMGDAGSLLLGLYAAAMMIMFAERGIPRWVLGSIMIFGLPILDTSLALLRRLRLRRPIFVGDRSHLYDQLVDRGFTVRQTVGICYALAAFYGIVGLSISILVPQTYGFLILLLCLAVALLTMLLCWKLGFLKPPVESPQEGNAEPSGSPPARQQSSSAS